MMRGGNGGRRAARARRTLLGVLAVGGLSSCGDAIVNPVGVPGASAFEACDLDINFLYGAAGRDAIPSLDEPEWDRANEVVPNYLEPSTRVIGIEMPGQGAAYAIPHNVLWHHEVMNMDVDGENLAVTYCPLAGSSSVFDRKSIDGAPKLGVSGILFMTNLIMYDRRGPGNSNLDSGESLWPQLIGEARCGPSSGTKLAQYPFVEIEWASWLELHPDTWVLSGPEEQGFDPEFFNYHRFGYPYGPYETIPAWFNGVMPPLDGRRFSKERVIGLPSGSADPGIAFPFGALEDREGTFQVVPFTYEETTLVLLWSDDAQGGTVFRPLTESGTQVAILPTGTGFLDAETGSTWSLEGRAVSGPMAGERLEPLEKTNTSFWGAWSAFHPQTRLWEG